MLAPAKLPERFARWNHEHGAPRGRPLSELGWRGRFLSRAAKDRYRGPFALQPNNTTRAFEYPWAYEVAALKPGMRVLEVGGGLAGYQFLLDRAGCRVVNVDPGPAAEGVGWPCDQKRIAELNERFGTRVELRNTTIEKADLPEASFDRVFSLSVLEHLPLRDALLAMENAYGCLKPGGLFVLTVDLFLNLKPFTTRLKNEYGSNLDIRCLLATQDWEIHEGRTAELYGFPEFDAERIQSHLEDYLRGQGYPALIQCVVLRKPVAR